MTNAKLATAVHEAAHAVAAWWQNLEFTTISVEPDDDTLGRVVMGALPEDFAPDIEVTLKDRDLIERQAVVLLAGETAERHYLEQIGARVDDVLLADQAAHDRANAVDITGYLIGRQDEHEAYLGYLAVRALVIVETRWQVIEALADAVIKAGSLTWPQAVPVIRAASLNKTI